MVRMNENSLLSPVNYLILKRCLKHELHRHFLDDFPYSKEELVATQRKHFRKVGT